MALKLKKLWSTNEVQKIEKGQWCFKNKSGPMKSEKFEKANELKK